MPPSRASITRLIALSMLVVMAATVAACDIVSSVAGPREWTQEVQMQDGSTQTITVRDTSGKIIDVEIDPPGIQDPGVIANPDGRQDQVLVPWSGGACDTSTTVDFAAQGSGLVGSLQTETTGDVCVMMAVPHVLLLTTNGPMPAASVTLEFVP